MKEIILSGDVGYEITAASIREQLDMNSSATVRLKINSPGGHVFEAFEIYNLIKEYKGTVIAEITGMAASAASYIALGADKLQVHKNSTLMLHRAWNIAIGNSVDFQKEANILNDIDGIIADDYAKKSKKNKSEVMDELTNEIWLIGSDKITASGLEVSLLDDDSPDAPETETEARARVSKILSKMKTENISNKMDLSIFNKYVTKEQEEEKPLKQSLADYLKDNPEAKADIFAFVEKEKPAPDPKAEAERITELLNLSGVKISAELKAAIDEGKTPEAFALAAMKKQNEIANSTNAANLGKPAASAQTPADVMEKETPAAKTGALVDAEAIRALAKKTGGKK